MITRVDLRLRPGVDLAAFRDKLRQRLPAGLTVERPETSLAASASLSRSYRVNLNVLALVALFTGGLLVFSTQALAVVQRRGHFALLRVLGTTRRQLVASLLAEALLIGAAGSALGLGAGFILAQAAVRHLIGGGHVLARAQLPLAQAELLRLGGRVAAGIAGRQKIATHLATGISLIDLLVPLGRGQLSARPGRRTRPAGGRSGPVGGPGRGHYRADLATGDAGGRRRLP